MGKSAWIDIKKGEVVEPAGGETGVPHCLAEALSCLKQRNFTFKKSRLMPLYKIVK